MSEEVLVGRLTVNPRVFGGKPIIRGRRPALEDVLDMLAAGDTIETILEGYEWLEREKTGRACFMLRRLVDHERFQPLVAESAS